MSDEKQETNAASGTSGGTSNPTNPKGGGVRSVIGVIMLIAGIVLVAKVVNGSVRGGTAVLDMQFLIGGGLLSLGGLFQLIAGIVQMSK